MPSSLPPAILEYPEYPDKPKLLTARVKIGGHPKFRKENNKLQVSHVTGVRTQNSLFNFKIKIERYFYFNSQCF